MAQCILIINRYICVDVCARCFCRILEIRDFNLKQRCALCVCVCVCVDLYESTQHRLLQVARVQREVRERDRAQGTRTGAAACTILSHCISRTRHVAI